MLSRLNSMLISKTGIATLVALLVGCCGWAAYYTSTNASLVVKDQQDFFDSGIEQGFVAMNDIHRLNVVVIEGLVSGGFSENHRVEFEAAVDFLFTRVAHFHRLYPETSDFEPAKVALKYLDRIVELSDEFIQNDHSDLSLFSKKIIPVADKARTALYHYSFDMSKRQREIMSAQSQEVLKQTRIFWFAIAALSAIGAIAILQLRREVLERKARNIAEQRVRFLAFFDSLTKLPNRVQFQDYLNEKLKEEASFAVLIADIDHFKLINDKLGHAIGDEVLCQSAKTFADVIQAHGGLPARLSGDEFAALVPEDSPKILEKICTEILERIKIPYHIDGEHIASSMSIGVATTNQISQFDESLLMRIADFSLYASKQAGRGQFMIYDDKLDALFQERDKMKEELPDAIRRGELQVFLQPQAMLPNGEVYGFEALVRWMRNGKLCFPDSFIPIAEDTNDIIEIDFFMLREAVRMVANWNQKHATSYSISVNLSALHLSEQLIFAEVQRALDESQLPAELLILEITETVQLNDWKTVASTLEALRKTGVRVAIDDFGCGYSSLAYLRTMTVDELKIDRSLLVEIETSKEARYVVSAVVELAKNLEIEVIVEGVEEQIQADIAYSIGVERMQGYLIGKPVPALEALLAAGVDRPELPTPESLESIMSVTGEHHVVGLRKHPKRRADR